MLERLLDRLRGRRAASWVDQDIRAEIETHIAMRTEDNETAGLPADEARRQAERRFGDRERILRQARAERLRRPLPASRGGGSQGGNPLSDLIQDARFGLRMMAKTPAFTSVAVLSLALGIGFNTAVFSVVDAVLFRPLQVHEPARLVRIARTAGDVTGTAISYPDMRDIGESAGTLAGVAGYRNTITPFNADGRAEFLFGEAVTDNLFEVLGVPPLLGRDFDPSENVTSGAHFVAMISEDLWRDRFGTDPGIVGEDIVLAGKPYAIVGVVPGSYKGGTPPVKMQFWVPMAMINVLTGSTSETGLLERRGQRGVTAVARLAPGASFEQAAAEVASIGEALAAEHPDTNGEARLSLLEYTDVRFDPAGDRLLLPAAGVFMGIVGLILLIACANVASMMLSRATVRGQEMAIRLALGASRGRLVRQTLTESLLLAMVGGALGALLADLVVHAALALQPPVMVPISLDVRVDLRVLGFTALLAGLTGVIFGLVPALQGSRQDLGLAMKAGEGRRASGSVGGWLRSGLVVVQVAVSLILLVAAALLMRSLANARHIDPGFATEDIVALSAGLRMQGYTPEEARDFMGRLEERVAALPGAEVVAFAERMPLESSVTLNAQVWLADRPLEPQESPPIAWFASVSPSYFELFRIPMLSGRAFEATDVEEAPGVAIVNPTFAERFWPGDNPIGKRLSTVGPDGPWIEVVAVNAPHKIRTLGEEPEPHVYRPYAQEPSSGFGTLAVRTHGDAGAMLEAMRREMLSLDANLAVMEAETIRQHMSLSLFPVRAAAWSLMLLGGVGATLAAIGVYGVVAFAVSRRTREIGIRMAVGADRGSVVRMVVRQGLRLALTGVAIGVGASLVVTRALAALLYGISPGDLPSFAAAAVVLVAVALLANLIPARRAGRVDPVAALRSE